MKWNELIDEERGRLKRREIDRWGGLDGEGKNVICYKRKGLCLKMSSQRIIMVETVNFVWRMNELTASLPNWKQVANYAAAYMRRLKFIEEFPLPNCSKYLKLFTRIRSLVHELHKFITFCVIYK